MQVSRRDFTRGAIALAASGSIGTRAFAQVGAAFSPQQRAVGAIQEYAEAHRAWFKLPGLTLGVTSPSGYSSVVHSGLANMEARTPITGDTFFQIGSISKNFTSAIIHQYVEAGRLKLSDRLSDVLPHAPLPAGNAIEIQHVLDHVAGLPGDSPTFPDRGLWTAYAPGQHWHYSNTGYDLIGRLAEHLGGKPLDQLLAEHDFRPMGMNRSRGAIVGADRLLYAQGYEQANTAVPFVRGTPLAPAPWVDVTTGAGCIASTAADMNLYLRSLANAAQGRGGLGLGPQAGMAFTSHAVASDTPEMTYGNGLMHVVVNGRRYLHHTGGMVASTSSFHVDTQNGVGAFASTTLNAFSGYRPRRLTQFAVDALAAAEAGRPLPDPPALESPIDNPAQFVGRYSAGGRTFQVRSKPQLTIVSNGTEAPLESFGGDSFGTLHPDFRQFAILFERNDKKVAAASWGSDTFVRDGSSFTVPPGDPALAALAGRYVNDSPWFGTTIVVERGGKLWMGTDTPMTKIGDNLWRVGDEAWSPERASFTDYSNGRPQTLVVSATDFARQDT